MNLKKQFKAVLIIMFNRFISLGFCLSATAMLAAFSPVQGGETNQSSGASQTQPDTRYGLFNLMDHKSAYGDVVFPEPFLIDDSNLETDEARVDWFHTKGTNHQSSDLVTAEVEKGFGLLTLEIEVPFERDTSPGQTLEGMSNIDLGARCPVYQFVSGSGLINTTFGAAVEVGIPTNSSVSKNTELVPKIFNDLKIGQHFTVQTVLGYSMLYGSGDVGGLQTFEYGFVFGYMISHRELPLPGVIQLIPVFELSGQTQTNKEASGHNRLSGDVGFRCNLKPIGPIQPKPGVAFVFPIDNGAREDMHCGVVVSLVLEY